MSVHRNEFNWDFLAKKGELENQLKEKLSSLKKEVLQKILEDNNSRNLESAKLIFNKFQDLIQNQLDETISNYSFYTDNEKNYKKQQFNKDLLQDINLLVEKKALCSIKFDGYSIYNFFKSLSLLLPEIEFIICEDKIYIIAMDPLRIVTFEITISNYYFKFYNKGKIGCNLNDLQKALKCKASDETTTNMIFGKDKLYLTIKSKKFKSQIERELSCIDFHQSGIIDIEKLHKITYPCHLELSKERISYLLENFGLYSEIIKIQCDSNRISFRETSPSGNNEISWNNDSSLKIEFKPDELNMNGLDGAYSLEFFTINNKMASLLEKSEGVLFFLKSDYPLKSEIKFSKLGDVWIKFYISPRG